MRILGIDPGSRVCGYGMIVAAEGGALTYVECGVLTAPEDRPAEWRLGEIARGLGEVLDELRPDVVAVEDVFTRINPRSALALAQARGMVLAVVGLRGLAVASYPAPQVKKMITGRGRAEKDQVARMVQALVGLRSTPRADAADALSIAIAHARTAAVEAATATRIVAAAAAGRRAG
ncbi:MAG TPA: crossover junction endodeoxyribonuclease RuvC [Kofleriaceae bacterium]|nr:crossover junction endodeoxyribonuclease RuvC [Kofleriaceae bacterium]